MISKDKLMSQLLLTAKALGLPNSTPVLLNEAANLIIHLSPYPIVARVATVGSEEDPEKVYKQLVRELKVARHLQTKGVPVLAPITEVDAGPHEIDGIWLHSLPIWI